MPKKLGSKGGRLYKRVAQKKSPLPPEIFPAVHKTRQRPSSKFMATAAMTFSLAMVVMFVNRQWNTPVVYSQTPPPNPTHRWTFDDGTAAASVGGINGDVRGTPSVETGAKCAAKGCLRFHGEQASNDAVVITKVPIQKSFTVSLWASSDTAQWNTHGWLASARGANGFIIHPNLRENRWGGYVVDNTGRYTLIGTVIVSDITKVHAYALRYNAVTGEGAMFVDGVRVASKRLPITRAAGNVNIYVGKDEYSDKRYGLGTIDELVLYDRALSDAQVAGLTRDTRRKQDLEELRQAMEKFYDLKGTYRVRGGGWRSGTTGEGGGEGWVSFQNNVNYPKSVASVLKDLGLLGRSDYYDPIQKSTGYMIYVCDDGKRFSLSARLELGTDQEKSDAEDSCNGIGSNGTVNRYGKNYAVSGSRLPVIAPGAFDPASAGVVGQWLFESGSLKDAKQNRDAANNGATLAADRKGGANNAYEVASRAGQYINASALSAYKMSTELTMEAWVYPTADGVIPSGGGGIIINKEGEYEIARFNNGRLYYALANQRPGWAWINTGFLVPLNTWTHLVFTYSADAGAAKLYANGEEVYRSTSARGNIGDMHGEFNDLRFGGRQRGDPQGRPGQFFDGRFDTVRLYNKALSKGQVKALYERETGVVQPEPGQRQGLIASFSFDDGKANDPVGGNNGVLTGTAPVDGKIGKALSFNGTSDYVKVLNNPASPLFNLTSALTYALWVKPSGQMPLVEREQCDLAWPSAELALVGRATPYTVRFLLNDRHANTYKTFTADNAVTQDQWSHIAATYDKATKTVKIYVNGQEKFSGVDSTGYSKTIWKPTTPLWIGGIPKYESDPACWKNYGKGLIDEVKIYDRALAASEVGQLAGRSMGQGAQASSASSAMEAFEMVETAAPPAPDLIATPERLQFFSAEGNSGDITQGVELELSNKQRFIRPSVVRQQGSRWIKLLDIIGL